MNAIRFALFLLVSLVGHAAVLIPVSNQLIALFDGDEIHSDSVLVSISVISNSEDSDQKSARPDELYHAFREQAPLVHPPISERLAVATNVPVQESFPDGPFDTALTTASNTPVTSVSKVEESAPPSTGKEVVTENARDEPDQDREVNKPQSPQRSASANAAASDQSVARKLGLQAEGKYLAELLQAVSGFRTYPSSARRRGHQGTVEIELVIRKDGGFDSIEISKPSDYKTLNRASYRAINKLKRFKPFPKEIKRESWHISIPFRYVLQANVMDNS